MDAALSRITDGNLFSTDFLRERALDESAGSPSLLPWVDSEDPLERTRRLSETALGFGAVWVKGDPAHPHAQRPVHLRPSVPDLLLFASDSHKRSYARGRRGQPPCAVVVFEAELTTHAVDLELKFQSPWSGSPAVLHTDGARWRLYLRAAGTCIGETHEGPAYYEFDAAAHAKATYPGVGRCFTLLADVGASAKGLADTARRLQGLRTQVCANARVVNAHFANLAQALARERVQPEDVRLHAATLTMRCALILMLEGQHRLPPRLSPLLREERSSDQLMWPKLRRGFDEHRCSSVWGWGDLMRPIRGVDDEETPRTKQETTHVHDALRGLGPRLGELAVEDICAMYERILDAEDNNSSVGKGPRSSRRAAGAYFTPPALASRLVSDALKPHIERALGEQSWDCVRVRINALRILDPSVGAGNFLTEAARLLRAALADASRGRSVAERDRAFADALSACIFGVDVDSTAVSLARVALSTLEPSSTAGLVDHIRVGDSFWSCVSVDDLDVPAGSDLDGLCRAIWKGGDAPPDVECLRLRLCEHARASGTDWVGDWPLDGGDRWKQTPAFARLREMADKRVGHSGPTHFHWCLEFPCVVGASGGGFHVVCGNPPWADVGAQYMRTGPDLANLAAFLRRESDRRGMYALVPRTRHNMCNCFVHRAVALADCEIACVLANTFLTNLGSTEARRLLHTQCPLKTVHSFSLRATRSRIFPGVNHAACLLLASKSHRGGSVRFTQDDGTPVEVTPVAELGFLVPALSSETAPLFSKLSGETLRLRSALVSAKGTPKKCSVHCTGQTPIWEGVNIIAPFTLGGDCKARCELDGLPRAHAWHRARARIGMRQVVNPDHHARTAAVLLGRGEPCDASVLQFFPKDPEAPDDVVYAFLALLNASVADWYVRRLTGESKNVSQGAVLDLPMPAELHGARFSDASAEWETLLAMVPLRAPVLGTVRALFATTLDSAAALLSHGARAQTRECAAWVAADPSARKLQVRKFAGVDAFVHGGPAGTDRLRRGQVLLNHLVARAYGLTCDELRAIHSDLERFWS